MSTLKSYNLVMVNTFGEWFFKKHLEYEKLKKRRVPQTEFARYIGVSQATLSNWMNETNKPSAEAALKLAAQFDDQTILSILGYALPADSDDSPDQEMTRQKEELLYKFDQLSDIERQTILDMLEFLLSKQKENANYVRNKR